MIKDLLPNKMTEKIMQDLLKKYPYILIEDGVKYCNREVVTGNRRLDLVFIDQKKRLLLVEVQKGSLDTKHIDRHIDFVEGFIEKNPNVDIRLIYIANRIDHLRKLFLERRGYEYLEIPETKFFKLMEDKEYLLGYHEPQFELNNLVKDENVNLDTLIDKSLNYGNSLIIKKMLSLFSVKKENVLKRKEIIRMVLNKFPDTNQGSIIPSDYCYNIINKDSRSFSVRLFKFRGSGEYLCLGLNYPYNGDILWKGKIVGKWQDGKYTLYTDPRNLS